MAGSTSLELLGRWRDEGDQAAATELFNRYVSRLIALARSKLAPALARRLDADDVVQSACRSFFVRVRDGRLLVQAGDPEHPEATLWNLLAAITVNKLRRQVARHTGQNRSVMREEDLADASSMCWLDVEALARDPGPQEQAALAEECEKAMTGMLPLHRQMVELRLQELTTPEIADKVHRTQRMVRLVLSEFGKKLQKRLAELAEPA